MEGPTRNATDFEKKFRRIRDDYMRVYAPALTDLQRPSAPMTATTDQEFQEELQRIELARTRSDVLEYQVRAWVIDGFLHSLNWIQNSAWSIQPTPINMLPEATVISASGTKRRMDYFGYERTTHRPLLIVEAKRPSDTLPIPPGGLREETIPSLIVKGLKAKTKFRQIPKQWIEWLYSLRDYVRSTKVELGSHPLRAVLTNGEWCLIFLNPERTFSDDDGGRPEDILVYETPAEMLSRAGEIVFALERSRVLGESPDLEPGQLRFAIDVNSIDRLAFGLRLAYATTPTVDESILPVITLVPVVLARSAGSSWVRIRGAGRPRQIPTEAEQLPSHLNQMQNDAENLMAVVHTQLDNVPPTCTVVEHYESPNSFAGHPGVLKLRDDQWVVFTGSATHYLRAEPSVGGCKYHDWFACKQEGVQQGDIGIYGKAVVSPRAFFESGGEHHCAHRAVFMAKQSPLTEENRARCGPRSGQDVHAFCEIAPFEDYLCCRTCVFENVCTKAEVFRLPCAAETNDAAYRLIQLH